MIKKKQNNTEVLCQVRQRVNNFSLDFNVQHHLQTQITGIKCDAREFGTLTPHRRITIPCGGFLNGRQKWKRHPSLPHIEPKKMSIMCGVLIQISKRMSNLPLVYCSRMPANKVLERQQKSLSVMPCSCWNAATLPFEKSIP